MLEVRILSVEPEAADSRQSPEKGHMVFRVQVRCGGRRHTLPRRYSEFHALHKRKLQGTLTLSDGDLRQIKKLYRVPDFPSKRRPGWRTRGLEQQRLGLEAYVQGILYMNQEVPKELLEFLGLRHCPPSPADPKASSRGSQRRHRPVVGFCLDPYVCTPVPELLPSVVVRGVLRGLYESLPDNQPEACSHPPPRDRPPARTAEGQATCLHSRGLWS